MHWFALLTRRTTSGQRTVAVWTLVLLLAVTGGVALYFSTQAAKPEDIAELRSIGYCSFALAAVILIVKKLLAVFLDS